MSVQQAIRPSIEKMVNYSAVERKTMKALGKDRLVGWRIAAERQRIVPERVKIPTRNEAEGRRAAERSEGGSNVGEGAGGGVCCLRPGVLRSAAHLHKQSLHCDVVIFGALIVRCNKFGSMPLTNEVPPDLTANAGSNLIKGANNYTNT